MTSLSFIINNLVKKLFNNQYLTSLTFLSIKFSISAYSFSATASYTIKK